MIFSLLNFKRFPIFILSIALFSSCSLFNTDETIPSYIHIDKINFNPGDTNIQPGYQGGANITDAWVYIDGQSVGAYELPATFPVPYEGVHDLKVEAGIKMNGVSGTRIAYPFYDLYETSVSLTAKQVTTVSPAVNYFSGITFPFFENFQGAGFAFVDTMGDARLRVVTADSAWGNNSGSKSGYARITGNAFTFQARSSTTFPLAANGHTKFIELNYKCNHTFVVGLTFGGATNPVVGIRPSSNWNKIYINVTDQILLSGNYGIYIATERLGSDNTDPELYLDNIKFVYN